MQKAILTDTGKSNSLSQLCQEATYRSAKSLNNYSSKYVQTDILIVNINLFQHHNLLDQNKFLKMTLVFYQAMETRIYRQEIQLEQNQKIATCHSFFKLMGLILKSDKHSWYICDLTD